MVEKEPLERSRFNASYVVPLLSLSLTICCAMIIHIHSQSSDMSCACIHLGVHNHVVFIGVHCESLDMAFKCLANKVSKTPYAKKSTIVMAVSKQFLVDYILKSSLL